MVVFQLKMHMMLQVLRGALLVTNLESRFASDGAQTLAIISIVDMSGWAND